MSLLLLLLGEEEVVVDPDPVVGEEQIILDPVELAPDRVEFDLTPWLADEGIDWDDATVDPYRAQLERGETIVDMRIPNRVPQGPLLFVDRGGDDPMTALGQLQAKVALLQLEGGFVKRTTPDGEVMFADVVSASLRATSTTGLDSRNRRDLSASFTLEMLPDWYGAEVVGSVHT